MASFSGKEPSRSGLVTTFRRHRRAMIGIWIPASVAATCVLTLGDNPDVREAPLEWGVYQILWSREFGNQLDTEVAKFASKPHYVMYYRDLGRPYTKRVNDAIHKRGATAIVSLELWSWHGGHEGSYLPLINDGKYDDFFREWATDAKKDGHRVLLRFGFEANGDWFTWGGAPAAYIAAWRRAHAIFREVGASNVEWVWSPNIVSVPNTPKNSLYAYYPGSEFVDWVGVDGYNFGDHHDIWHKWQSFADVFDKVLDSFEVRYPDKPVMIAEFGCAPDKPGQRERWIREAHANLRKRRQVKAVIWFNLDKRREKEPNWRIDQSSDSLQAFNETFAAPPRPGK